MLIPATLRDKVVDLTHEGHQGLTKTNIGSAARSGGLEFIDKLKLNVRPAMAASWLDCPHHQNP